MGIRIASAGKFRGRTETWVRPDILAKLDRQAAKKIRAEEIARQREEMDKLWRMESHQLALLLNQRRKSMAVSSPEALKVSQKIDMVTQRGSPKNKRRIIALIIEAGLFARKEPSP